MSLQSINPATEHLIASYPVLETREIEERIRVSQIAFLEWSQFSFEKRGAFLNQVATLLEKNQDAYAHLMASEMGKPLNQGVGEVLKCAHACRYFAKESASFLQPQKVNTEAQNSYIMYQPLGIIFGIMPWNFPFWQVLRFAAPTLMAGNGVIIKHAPNVCGCALALEQLMQEAGLPQQLFQSLIINEDQVAAVIKDPMIKAITLTGSQKAGRVVAALSGAELKKIVLELGGSDPYIILEDANLEEAADVCVKARIHNAGQVCISAKRLIVVKKVYQDFRDLIVEKMKNIKMGNPLEEGIDMGPMAREDLRKNLHRQIQKSIAQGAQCLLGCEIPKGSGYFYPSSVLTNVRSDMPVFCEEVFGPVACIIPVEDEKEAIHLANKSDFGLGAAVFTADISRGEKIAGEKLEAGNCVVNTMVRSDPRLPFGGVKGSGYGRELGAIGIREFVNIKTVFVK